MSTLGIDLGTTYCAVARVDGSGRPKIINNREGEPITPSVVLFQGEQVLVGSTAKHSAVMFPDDCVQFVKRFMGDPHWNHVDSSGTVRRPEQISALLLRRLVDDAEMMSGETFADVVVTVPAYFDDARRQATKDAAGLAGLNVVRLLNEPTAAAIAYGMDHSDAGTILVYDLGGGTFDVTVLRREESELAVVATDGDRNLGGFDFDNALMMLVAERVEADGGPDLFDGGSVQNDLRERCELAKRTLSNVPKATVHLSADGKNFAVPVTRAQFEEATESLMFRTQVVLESVLEEAGLGWSGIDRILLVGGSTRMPMVRELVTKLAGKQPEVGVNPDEAVALGAGAVAALITESGPALAVGSPAVFHDVTSQGLGIAASSAGRMRNAVIINRNSRIPCQRDEQFFTMGEDQRVVDLQIIVGDDEDLDSCSVVSRKPIDLPAGLAESTPIKVKMSYDLDGIVHVELSLPGAGPGGTDRHLGEVELERPANIDPGDPESMRTSMSRLSIE